MAKKGGKQKTKETGKGKKPKKPEVKKEEAQPIKKKTKLIEGVRGILRVAETDILGHKKLGVALLKVRGVGKSLANAIPVAANLDSSIMIGKLSDEDIKKIEDIIRNPIAYGIPYHMVNRKRDPATGENRHVVSSELKFTTKSDIDFLKKIRTYRGMRHEYGLPVRGQRTRSSFRKGGRVGVSKKREQPRKKAA